MFQVFRKNLTLKETVHGSSYVCTLSWVPVQVGLTHIQKLVFCQNPDVHCLDLWLSINFTDGHSFLEHLIYETLLVVHRDHNVLSHFRDDLLLSFKIFLKWSLGYQRMACWIEIKHDNLPELWQIQNDKILYVVDTFLSLFFWLFLSIMIRERWPRAQVTFVCFDLFHWGVTFLSKAWRSAVLPSLFY